MPERSVVDLALPEERRRITERAFGCDENIRHNHGRVRFRERRAQVKGRIIGLEAPE